MERQAPNHQNTRRMVQGPQTHCHGRQRSKEGGNTPHPRLRHCRTPRNDQNPCLTKQKLLVARDKKLRNPIRQRMCPVPITEEHYYATQTPSIPHLNQPRSTTFRMHSPGLHHQTATVRRIQLNTNNNRPRLLKRIHIHPMQRNNQRHRGRQTLRQTRISPLRTPPESHLRPRPPIHGHRDEGTLQKPEHQTEHQHHLPPTDRWTIRTNQPMAGTIPLNIRKRSTNGLGQMATPRPIYTQHLAKCDDGQIPLRANHGARTIRTCGKNPLPSAHSQLQTRPDQSHEASCATSHNACPSDNNQGNQIRTLPRRAKGLARGNPPENNTPYGQTKPPKIRSLLDNKKTLTCGLSAAHSTAMENPRHLPRSTPHPI